MKKSLRLACGFGLLAGSFALVGCDGGSSDEGLPDKIEVNPVGAEAMKNMKPMGVPEKKPPLQGSDKAAPAPAPAEGEAK
jgi:hypothetical protein